jgi:hypothetical protein
VETLIILVVAAALSAAVVWWAMSPPAVRASRDPRPRRARPAPARGTSEEPSDGFVLLPGDARIELEDRPNPAWSVVRLVAAIAIVSAIVVAAVALIGLFLKLQLDQYFTTGT